VDTGSASREAEEAAEEEEEEEEVVVMMMMVGSRTSWTTPTLSTDVGQY